MDIIIFSSLLVTRARAIAKVSDVFISNIIMYETTDDDEQVLKD